MRLQDLLISINKGEIIHIDVKEDIKWANDLAIKILDALPVDYDTQEDVRTVTDLILASYFLKIARMKE